MIFEGSPRCGELCQNPTEYGRKRLSGGRKDGRARLTSIYPVEAGPKRSLVTMSAEERSARAKIASLAAAKKRTEKRLEREDRTARKAPKKSPAKAR